MTKSISFPVHLELGEKGLNFERADIKLRGIDQAGNSFEGRVFLNNPAADENTPTTKEHGYAGSFHVYGFGLSPEETKKETAREASRPVVRAPIEKVVMASEAVRTAGSQGADVLVTVVPVYAETPQRSVPALPSVQDASIIIS